MLRSLLIGLLLAACCIGGTYTSVVPTSGNLGFWDFYYQGRDFGWDTNGGSASYYYDCCPSWRNHHYAFLRTSLPVIPAGETFLGATLYIQIMDAGDFGGSYGSAVLKDAGNMTGGSGDLMGAGSPLYSVYAGNFGWRALDVSSAVQAHYGLGYTDSSFILGPAGAGTGYSYLSFSPAGTGSDSPYLEVTTVSGVPEPSAFSLASIGCLLWCAARLVRGRRAG